MDRIRGIDVARAVAILGMFAAHIRSQSEPAGVAETIYSLVYGRAAILFGVVAGIGVSLLANSPRATPARTAVLLLWRAAVLLPLGLALQHLDHGVFVILANYAALFAVATLLVHLPDRLLVAVGGVSALFGTAAYRWGELSLPAMFTRDPILWGDSLGEILVGLVATGPYPLITWLAPFAFGVWLGRRNLRSAKLGWSSALAGGSIAVVVNFVPDIAAVVVPDLNLEAGWLYLLNAEPHNQTTAWIIESTASAAAVIGGCLLLTVAAPRLSWPLVAAGQLAFTLYVLQLIALDLAPDALRDDEVGGAVVILAGFAVVSVLLAMCWRAFFSRGPLEYVLRLPSAVFQRRR